MSKIDEENLSILIEQIKKNDTSAFKDFFCLYQPGIYYFLYRYTSDPEAARDLTQDTFVSFWKHRDNLDCCSSPKSYLYKIARNLAINHVTRKSPVSSFSGKVNFLVHIGNNPMDDYDHLMLFDDYQRAINLLPERCRATFILSRFEGLEYSEIAKVLNVSIQTVKNQMNKAFAVLRKHLSQYLD
jgi:RNA polymerase sigma-70 factor, ECF subfamily